MSVNLSIKDVPDDMAQRLRERAARHHRSLQGELMAIIERAATELPGSKPAARTASSRANDDRSRGFRRGSKTVEEVVSDLRRRFPKPATDLPRSVDIVRAARDSR